MCPSIANDFLKLSILETWQGFTNLQQSNDEVVVGCGVRTGVRWSYSRAGGLPPNNVVPLDHRCHAHARCPVFIPPLHAHDFSERPHKDFRAMRNLRGECKGNVQLRPRLEVLLNDEIQPTRRNVARFSLLGIVLMFGRYPNNDWQRQIVTTSRSAFRHSPDLRYLRR